MDDYKPNSHRFKQEQARLAESQPHTGTKELDIPKINKVKIKKKSELQKATGNFIAEDLKNVGLSIWSDVVVPTFKKVITDIVTEGINRLIYGDSARPTTGSTASKISYGSFYKNQTTTTTTRSSTVSGFMYDDILFPTRGDAEMVLDAMRKTLIKYSIVSVADMYDIAQVPTDNPQLNKYGWISLGTASIVRTLEGEYIIKLPQAQAIE